MIRSPAPAQRSIPVRVVAVLLFSALATACARGERTPDDAGAATKSITVSRSGVNLSVKGEREVTNIARRASALDANTLLRRPGWRREQLAAVPFLTQTREGRRFLTAARPRALARGVPADFCPVMTVSTTGERETVSEAVRTALSGCLNAAATLPDGEECGCEIVALNDILTIPSDEAGYASSVELRLRADFVGLDTLLVASDAPDGSLLIRSVDGVIGRIAQDADGRAVLALTASQGLIALPGIAVPVGFRRGRIATRYYFEDSAGNRAVALVGFGPDELASGAARWLAFPDAMPDDWPRRLAAADTGTDSETRARQ
ncbi:MAG: hypothetical protein AAF899_05535 [Pseudomonadota bacterium]